MVLYTLQPGSLAHLSHIVETLQDPADSAVAAAHENLILFNLAKDVQAAQRASVAEVEHLRKKKIAISCSAQWSESEGRLSTKRPNLIQ